MDTRAVETLIYQQSGLLGVSGVRATCARCWRATRRTRREAIELRVPDRPANSARSPPRSAGSTLVFTAGIGENSPRSGAASAATRPGSASNSTRTPTRGGPCISRPGSRASAWVIPTNEELMIARHTLGVIESQ